MMQSMPELRLVPSSSPPWKIRPNIQDKARRLFRNTLLQHPRTRSCMSSSVPLDSGQQTLTKKASERRNKRSWLWFLLRQRTNYAETVPTACWEYSTRPIYGWGDVGSKQKPTAGWLAAFPVFEPHWQICTAGGLSTGWIEWDGERYEFQDAPSYSEKNWGGAFPRKWFWVQCNVFEGASGEVALTAGGGLRQIPGLSETFENAALIGVHCGGKFYEFVPWNGVVSWEIATWGYWSMAAENETHMVELEATTEDPGTTLRAPTSEAGLAPACKDTCFGVLKLQMWERRYDGSKGKMILDVKSNMAAVEVGGGPWFSAWKGKTSTPELLKRAIGAPVDVEGAYNLVPLFKPPGL